MIDDTFKRKLYHAIAGAKPRNYSLISSLIGYAASRDECLDPSTGWEYWSHEVAEEIINLAVDRAVEVINEEIVQVDVASAEQSIWETGRSA